MRGLHGPNAPIFGQENKDWARQHPPGRYRVIASFRDADGFEHIVGEEWELVTAVGKPHDDESLLVVALDGKRFRYAIPLRWDIPAQMEVFESFQTYAVRVGPSLEQLGGAFNPYKAPSTAPESPGSPELEKQVSPALAYAFIGAMLGTAFIIPLILSSDPITKLGGGVALGAPIGGVFGYLLGKRKRRTN